MVASRLRVDIATELNELNRNDKYIDFYTSYIINETWTEHIIYSFQYKSDSICELLQ